MNKFDNESNHSLEALLFDRQKTGPVNSDYWIPFTVAESYTGSGSNTEGGESVTPFRFSQVPNEIILSVAFLKAIIGSSSVESLRILYNLWRNKEKASKNGAFLRTVELLYRLKNMLQESGNRHIACEQAFQISYHETISRIDLLTNILIVQITSSTETQFELPKWKGKAMQFIELISIGIELDLFEGQNQNQICNSLLKAFQVDAESDQPIYKQRFNALFRRSKVHLPLIANYINRVEEDKKMKIVLSQE